jgi:signal peptidase I
VRKTTALILSGIFPGLGQLYNHEFLKAALFVIPSVGLSWLVTRAISVDPLALIERGASPTVILAMLVLLAIWLWSVVDAWRSAGG